MSDANEVSSENVQGKGTGAIAKTVARVLWSQQWRAENPDSDAETRRAVWKEVRAEEIKKTRKLIKSLENSGVTMAMVARERKKDKASDTQDDDDLDLQD